MDCQFDGNCQRDTLDVEMELLIFYNWDPGKWKYFYFNHPYHYSSLSMHIFLKMKISTKIPKNKIALQNLVTYATCLSLFHVHCSKKASSKQIKVYI